jgi:NAD(P)-dependent dehydrogenase (short-subunit alcohol dehydrogenase family)
VSAASKGLGKAVAAALAAEGVAFLASERASYITGVTHLCRGKDDPPIGGEDESGAR